MTVSNSKEHLLNGKMSGKQIDFFEFVSEFIETVKVSGPSEQYKALVGSLSILSVRNYRFLKSH